jgi:NitT/TauT family transport system substrate-binding protein
MITRARHHQKPCIWLLGLVIALAGCGRTDKAAEAELEPVVLQTDWFPQPEHGGFYQALAKGYYAEEGLAVEILPGGPNAMSTQKVLKGRAHFAMNRADTIHSLVRRGVPVVLVMATLQHDPQALLLHAANPVASFEELDRQRVMAIPGLAWIGWLEARYGIELEIIPHDFGMERFLNDPAFIQQCLLTNEPFYAQQQGVKVKTLPLRDSGFDPYHGIYCLSGLAASKPGFVERFVRASVRGWTDYIEGDPAPAFELIAARNPKMSAEFMAFSYRTLRQEGLVKGTDGVGQLDPQRLDSMVNEMERLGLVEAGGEDMSWYDTRFLLTPADATGSASP